MTMLTPFFAGDDCGLLAGVGIDNLKAIERLDGVIERSRVGERAGIDRLGALGNPAGKLADQRVIGQAGGIGPALGIEIAIHQQFGKTEQPDVDFGMETPALHDFQRFPHFLKIRLELAFFRIKYRQLKAELVLA